MGRCVVLIAVWVMLASTLVATPGGATPARARWVITDLGTLGGNESEAVAINARGQIVGWADTGTQDRAGEQIEHGFLWQNARIIDLGALAGKPFTRAVAINEGGQVVGLAIPLGKSHLRSRPFLWERGRIRDLGIKRSGFAVAINRSGWVIGCYGEVVEHGGIWCSTWCQKAFLWRNGRTIDLGTLGGKEGEPRAINSRGQVVGVADTKARDKSGEPMWHAFLWEDGKKMRDLGTLGGEWSYSVAINDAGQVVGEAETAKINRADDYDEHGDQMHRGFIWARGRMRELGTFGGPDGAALAINRRGQIVGWADTRRTSGADRHMGETCGDFKYSHPAPRAFLWEHGRMRDLGTLGGLESEATAINDNGLVVGWADTKAQDVEGCAVGHAFVWEKARMTDLGTLPGGKASEAVAINNRGQIIGWSETRTGARRAVLWTLERR